MSPRAAAAEVGFDLGVYLDGERAHVEPALDRALQDGCQSLPRGVADAIRHGVTSGGKRLRPILCATAYRACGGTAEASAVYDLAVSLELIHAYSLMHDDLPCMDDADLRRGRATTHRLHGVEATVLGGAALIPMAVLMAWRGTLALGCAEDVARRVARELAGAAGAGGMVGGQALDLLGEGRDLTEEELDTLHRLKTGALLTASLRMGALAAGAGREALDALDEYGRAVGLAFQIADDVLDATSTAGDLGKNPSDAALGKSTYVTLHGLDEALRRGHELVESARAALDAGGLRAPALHAIARFVMERSS